MADPVANAANAPGAVVQTTPHRGVVAAQRARAGRGETLALIEAGKADPAAAKPSTPKPSGAPAPQPTAAKPAAKPAIAPTEEPSDDARETETEAQTETPAAPDVSQSVADPETTKRVATIQAAEKRSRDKIAAERKDLEVRAKAIETEWAPRVKAAEDFEAIKAKAAKARSNPAHLADLFSALGFTEDHFEPTSQALYSLSKAGQADPARKAHAEKILRDREQVDGQSALQKRIDDLEAKLEAKEQAQTFEQQRATFLDHTVKAIGDDAPIAKALATKNPTKLRAALWAATVELTDANDGEVPDFGDVVAHYEAQRRAELEELGLAPPKAAKQPTETETQETKPNNKTADKQNPARTLSNDLSTPRVPRPAQSGDEHRKVNRKETLRMLESGKLE